MTGRELIMYILSNNLEDEPVFKDGKLTGFLNEEDAALMYGVGVATVKTWVKRDMLPHVQVGSSIYIPIGVQVEGASFLIGEGGLKHYLEDIL